MREDMTGEIELNNGGSDYGLKVLVYHRIAVDDLLRKEHWSYVSVSQLRKQLKLLNSWGFTPITFNDLLLATSGEVALPKRPVILTFENGYRETYRVAFPLLKEFGMNGVVFALGDRQIKTDEWDKHLGLEPEELVTDDELARMNEAGFEIGSQSLTHRDLTTLSEHEAWDEIAVSKEVLESITESLVTSFSYPFGSIDKRTRDLVINAGYRFGCGIDTRPAKLEPDVFNIKRVTVTSSTNTMSFAVKMLAHNEQIRWSDHKTHDKTRFGFERDEELGIGHLKKKEEFFSRRRIDQ